MKRINFALKPFVEGPYPDQCKITGEISRNLNKINIRYEISGLLNDLIIPPFSNGPSRRDRLWEETCLELFIREKDADTYREINLSPSGNWNIYRFNNYRLGMQEENAFTDLPFDVHISKGTLTLQLEIILDKIIPVHHAITVGISAVMKLKGSDISFWALAHKGSKPDFHNVDNFIIEL
jgi:hypothetical protein